jgi:hypothetical protein
MFLLLLFPIIDSAMSTAWSEWYVLHNEVIHLDAEGTLRFLNVVVGRYEHITAAFSTKERAPWYLLGEWMCQRTIMYTGEDKHFSFIAKN